MGHLHTETWILASKDSNIFAKIQALEPIDTRLAVRCVSGISAERFWVTTVAASTGALVCFSSQITACSGFSAKPACFVSKQRVLVVSVGGVRSGSECARSLVPRERPSVY